MIPEKQIITSKFNDSAKNALVATLLITNAIVWYYFASNILKQTVGEMQITYLVTVLIWTAHYGGIGLSAIFGYLLQKKFRNRKTFLTFWMLLGILSSITSILVDKTNPTEVFLISLFLGVSLGIGMPSCMGYFTEKVNIAKRGRIGGLVLLLSGLGVFLLGLLSSDSLVLQTFILTFWRIFGLLAFLALKPKSVPLEKSKDPSYRSLIREKPFLLYFIPWLMFSLITYLTIPLQSALVGTSTVDFFMVVEAALMGIFAFVGGFFSDLFGRKRLAIIGFALLGFGYSVLGVFYNVSSWSWYIYTVVDGIALGLLYVVFVVTIWGDLNPNRNSDKYFALGVLPFFISKYVEYVASSGIIEIAETAIFSFTAFFLFLAVLPLVYAPETLPELIMRERELKTYVEKAQKKAQKKAAKEAEKKQNSDSSPDQSPSEEDEDEEIKRAEQLAEQYY